MRILVFVSYIGTHFRGSQTQLKLHTVDGCIEQYLKEILYLPGKRPVIYHPASRTDAGVHALQSAGTFDVENLKLSASFFKRINKKFSENNIQISINQSFEVPDTFQSRKSSLSKTYVYRFGIIPENCYYFPVSEINRTFLFKSNTFDVEKVKEAIKIFQGLKNYRAFLPDSECSKYVSRLEREINLILNKSQPLLGPHDPYSQGIKFFEVKCESKGFFKYLVRRIVGVILRVGQGKMTLDAVNNLFESPECFSEQLVYVVPPSGLYLANVKYDEKEYLSDDLCVLKNNV